tara:strand:+ start:2573 stop:3661 length:1089 start_codon:yes stop_codon:yes gene_type:complete
MSFPADLKSIQERVLAIDPKKYGASRNHKSGSVTRLSPYIARGVISTRMVFQHILDLDLPYFHSVKLIQELAWRDYWQQVWIVKGNAIDSDLKHEQSAVSNHAVPTALIQARTGIEAIDIATQELYNTGYMHNHMRMYIASITCNISHSHWFQPAQWMYANLLDGDWASNALSWQWVAGANANKKYYANQENINNFFESDQSDTFLDVSYEQFETMETPPILKVTENFELKTELPTNKNLVLNAQLPTCVYSYYNLDPKWRQDKTANRVLILEPSFFTKYPVAQKPLDFALSLSENIEGIQVFVGEFDELQKLAGTSTMIFKEHPTNLHFKGTQDERDWMFSVKGFFPSFFAFWKKCNKELK